MNMTDQYCRIQFCFPLQMVDISWKMLCLTKTLTKFGSVLMGYVTSVASASDITISVVFGLCYLFSYGLLIFAVQHLHLNYM
jgi:hypothetical protein